MLFRSGKLNISKIGLIKSIFSEFLKLKRIHESFTVNFTTKSFRKNQPLLI